MMDEVSRYSDVHHHQFQDYGSVQRLLHAFFNAMSGDHTRLLQMNDGTEIGRNRPMANSLFESDIVLTVDQLKGIVLGERDRRKNKSGRRSKRKVITGGVYRWPKNFHFVFLENWRHIIRESIRFWERETCVRWNENGHGVDGVIFVKGAGCYSSVGRTGGRQLISIGQGCGSIGIITHEIGHSLGFWHEQSRPDRDNFIRIISENIAKGTEGNFVKFTSLESDDLGVPFDFGSVMHYGPLAFTKDWKDITIETKDKRYSHTIGQRHGPSFIDVKQVNRLYCYDHCEISSLNCHNGGYPDPNNCTRCKCPMGLGGRLCEFLGDCGGELKATKGMKTLTYQGRNKCYWRIKSKNSRIRLVIDSVFLNCETTCQSFLEIKHNSYTHLDSGDPLPKPHAPHVPTWVPGREDRDFYSSSLRPGPIETFILNAIPQIRDPNRPIETIASIVTDYTVGTLLGARKS
uniref:Metalloendopeptidase n=1 Tax=Syphacia muris TaxID=451379 RepID=A0A158R635_9BILA